tara:strand:+ start:74 stop:1090 length:1017 start_codon:yes stop_codon:yes gene_type:complete
MLFLLSFFSFLIIFFILNKLALQINLVDKPSLRKIHEGKIPLIGGLIIYFNTLLFLQFLNVSNDLTWVIYSTIIIIIVSTIDDAKELGVNFRLISQLICSLIIIGYGITITNLGAFMDAAFITTGYFSVLFTVLCVMGLTNSFNFIDGLDGLCSSQVFISLFSIILFLHFNDKLILFEDLNLILFFCLNILFFIVLNLSKKFKIFLGDSGSLFLGFFVSWLLIIISQNYENLFHPVLTVWCVTIPVFEFFSVITRRSILGLSPFKSDRRHLHHILVDLGFSNLKVLFFFIIISISFNFIGFFTFYIFGPAPSLLFYLLLMFGYIFSSVLFMKYKNLFR